MIIISSAPQNDPKGFEVEIILDDDVDQTNGKRLEWVLEDGDKVSFMSLSAVDNVKTFLSESRKAV